MGVYADRTAEEQWKDRHIAPAPATGNNGACARRLAGLLRSIMQSVALKRRSPLAATPLPKSLGCTTELGLST